VAGGWWLVAGGWWLVAGGPRGVVAPEKAEVEELRRQRRMVDAAELITACSEYLLDFCLLTSAFCLLRSASHATPATKRNSTAILFKTHNILR
jgi:hypothetical protein